MLSSRSLDPIFESPRLDEELRSFVKATFPEFFQPSECCACMHDVQFKPGVLANSYSISQSVDQWTVSGVESSLLISRTVRLSIDSGWSRKLIINIQDSPSTSGQWVESKAHYLYPGAPFEFGLPA